MARPRQNDDDDDAEASATASFPADADALAKSDLTPFARKTLASDAATRSDFEATEKRRKANDLRAERDMRAAQGVLSKKVRDVLAAHYKGEPMAEDIVNRMMRAIDPVLSAGKEGNLRSRRLYVAAATAAKPAAA